MSNAGGTFRVGQVWERDGQRRKIVYIDAREFEATDMRRRAFPTTEGLGDYHIGWTRPNGGIPRDCWTRTWTRWAGKAKLVEEAR